MKAIFNIGYTAKSPNISASSEDKAAHMLRRKFYDMSAEYNYFTYTLNGKKVATNKDISSYMEKCDTPLFSQNKIYTEEELKALKSKLKKTESIIWHGFISFDFETTKGFSDVASAQKFLKQTVSVLFQKSGLDEKNIELFASMHTDTPHHRHIHFAFFEKEAKRRNTKGELCFTRKGTLPKAAIENYVVSANMHLDEKQYDYYSARDRAMEKLGEIRLVSINKTGNAMVKNMFTELCGVLPKTGRLQYNSSNIAPFRKKIDRAAMALINSVPSVLEEHKKIMQEFAHKQEMVQEICGKGKFGYVSSEISVTEANRRMRENRPMEKPSIDNVDYVQRLTADYYARLGNKVIGMVREMRADRTEKIRLMVNDKRAKIGARKQRTRTATTIKRAMTDIGNLVNTARADFTMELHRAEREIEQQYAEC